MQTSVINSKTQVCTKNWTGSLSSSWRWLILNVCHEAVDPQVHVLQRSVHQVSWQPAFPQVTFDIWNALHLCHQCSMLDVLPEQQRCFVWPLAPSHTCGRKQRRKITDLIKVGKKEKKKTHSSGTRQLCNNCLEGELSEVQDQALEHTPVDYFSFTIVQFIDTHRVTVMNLLHLHPVPPMLKESRFGCQTTCYTQKNNILHPDPTHHHLLFAYFCSIHPSLLDTYGAGAFPLASIVKKHVSHQDCQLVHVQPRLQHKVTGVMGQRHEHIHVLIRLKQERGLRGGFSFSSNRWRVNTKPHTHTHTWGSSSRGGVGRGNVLGVAATSRCDAPAPKRASFGTLTAGFTAGQRRTNRLANLATVIWCLWTELTCILTRTRAVESIFLCDGFAPWLRLGQLTVDALIQLQTLSADEQVHVDEKVLLLLL